MSNLSFRDYKICEKELKQLYKEAFSKNERVPFWILKIISKKKNVKLYGIYDGNKFIGLTNIICYKDITYVFYLAIDSNIRGRGYGTRVLDLLKQKYKNNRILLNVEEIDQNSNNYEQRIKRKKFYEKSGFYDLNYKIEEFGEKYEMLCYSKDKKIVSKEEYMEIMKSYFGKMFFNIIYKNRQ